MILVSTLFLIVTGAVYFYFAEFSDLSGGQRILASLFQSVTPRTAGFNTVDEAALSDTGKMVTIGLMLIGGSPGSTAGGMKTTTAALLIASCISVFTHRSNTNVYHRKVSQDCIRKAAAVFMMYIVLFLLAGMIISRIEGLPILDSLFETASAIGTVGLTVGITPTLGLVSRGILIFLMFFGRAGGLTLIYATVRVKKETSQYPQEEIAIG